MKFKLMLSNGDSVTTKELTPVEVRVLKESISLGIPQHLVKAINDQGQELEVAPAHVVALYPA